MLHPNAYSESIRILSCVATRLEFERKSEEGEVNVIKTSLCPIQDFKTYHCVQDKTLKLILVHI